MTEDWGGQFPDALRLAVCSVEMKKGQTIFLTGGEVDSVYRVLDGEVCLTRFSPEWIATLSCSLRRQRAAQERLGLKSLRMRVIHYIVDRGEAGSVELDQPIIRWATELGASHEALYRTLAKMEREGILQRQGQTLTLSRSSQSAAI